MPCIWSLLLFHVLIMDNTYWVGVFFKNFKILKFLRSIAACGA
jgi:hypothetical protein